ncbi:MAG: 50S ribosomal protein L20 [Klebsiella pneumoniae]|nr:50S ribosomal protein L20 [Klebsiella pneumoniae]
MARVKRGVIARARHKKILKQAKGYYGARSRVYRVAFQAVIKAGFDKVAFTALVEKAKAALA